MKVLGNIIGRDCTLNPRPVDGSYKVGPIESVRHFGSSLNSYKSKVSKQSNLMNQTNSFFLQLEIETNHTMWMKSILIN